MTVHNLLKSLKINSKLVPFIFFSLFIILALIFSISAKNVYSMEITLAWDAVEDESLVGYRMFYRVEEEIYDYNSPDWQGSDTNCIITDLDPNTKYYFVVRAYDSDDNESDNSNEVYYSPSENLQPFANAGSDQTVNENVTVFLNGLNSGDPDGIIKDYFWEQISGHQVALSDSSDPEPTFISPYVSSDENLIFQLTVTDYDGSYATDFCVVTVLDTEPNNEPLKPLINSPVDGTTETELMTRIITDPYSDPEYDSHTQTHWQVSEDSGFSSLLLDIDSNDLLTELTIPHLILDPNETYYARVQFSDGSVISPWSDWSDSIVFTTISEENDLNDNGIPDEKEIFDYIDMNGDGINDNDQPETIKCIMLPDNLTIIGVEKASESIIEMDALDTIDPSSLSNDPDKPGGLSFGLFSYRLWVEEAGATASVRIYFSEDISGATHFYKFDTIDGWQDYTENVIFNDDGRSITITIEDGGFGDSDGIANGVIVDPGGLVTLESSSSGARMFDDGAASSGGCFISVSEN
ncbi:MAG: choice-of-anchor U domain-containing protein [bacterium]